MLLRKKRPPAASPDRSPAPADGPRGRAQPVTPVGEPPQPQRAPTRPKRQRGRIVLASLLSLLMLGGAVAYTWWQARDDTGAAANPSVPVAGNSRSTLIVVSGENGRAVSLALLVSDGLDDRRLLVTPPDLTMQIPGYGDGSLGEALAIEDASLVRLALINELGIRIDETITIGPGDVGAILADAVRIDLPNAFIINTDDGEVVSASAGSDVFVPATAETLLVTQGADSPLEWLQRQRAVWEAIAGQVAVSPGPAIAIAPAFEPLADSLGQAVVSVLPVDRVGVGISELYVVSRDSELLNERIAFLALSDAPRPRVEILNATTLPGVTRPVAETLIEAGFRVIKTGNAEERFRLDTLIIAQGVPFQQAALDTQSLLGGGEVVVDSSGSGVVDVSIIVGRDVANR